MKNIFFGSIVAAALVFSGCGGSSSSSSGDNNNPGGGDTSGNKIDLNQSVNGFYLPDNNISKIVQKTWFEADQICKSHNAKLPSLAEVNATMNASPSIFTLFTDHNISVDANGNFSSVIWTSDKGSDYNASSPDRTRVYVFADGKTGEEIEHPESNASDHSYYFLCIPKK